MTVVLDHCPAQVSRYCHNGLFAGLTLRELGDATVPQIMEANLYLGVGQSPSPRRSPGFNRLRHINVGRVRMFCIHASVFARRERVMFGLGIGEPPCPAHQNLVSNAIEWNDPSAATFSLRMSYGQRALKQIYLAPTQRPNLVCPQSSVQ